MRRGATLDFTHCCQSSVSNFMMPLHCASSNTTQRPSLHLPVSPSRCPARRRRLRIFQHFYPNKRCCLVFAHHSYGNARASFERGERMRGALLVVMGSQTTHFHTHDVGFQNLVSFGERFLQEYPGEYDSFQKGDEDASEDVRGTRANGDVGIGRVDPAKEYHRSDRHRERGGPDEV